MKATLACARDEEAAWSDKRATRDTESSGDRVSHQHLPEFFFIETADPKLVRILMRELQQRFHSADESRSGNPHTTQAIIRVLPGT